MSQKDNKQNRIDHIAEIKSRVETELHRPLLPHEAVNLENDSLAIAQFLLTKVGELQDRVESLEALSKIKG